jgi:hypothetical protein
MANESSDAKRASEQLVDSALVHVSETIKQGIDARLQQIGEVINNGVQRQMAEVRDSMNKAVQNKFDDVAKSLRDAFVIPLLKAWVEIDERLKKMEPAAHALGQSGWTVPFWGPLFLAEDLIQMAPKEQFDSLFEGEYAADRRKLEREMFERLLLAPTLHRWQPMLGEIQAAYRRKHYRVAVPALLSILEGSVFFTADRGSSKRQFQSVLKDQLAQSTGSYERVAWASLSGFVGLVYGSHHFSKAPPKQINRHWVMHGRAEPEWQRVDCLRLLQALDTLVAADS